MIIRNIYIIISEILHYIRLSCNTNSEFNEALIFFINR